MQFLGPKNGGPFLNLSPLAPIKFSLKMVRGTKNGAQKWDPKMVPQKMKKCWQKHREIIAGKLLHWHAIATLDCISSSVISARTTWWHEMHSEILATLEHWYHLHSPSLKTKQFRTSFCEGAVQLIKFKIFMILPSCHLSSTPSKFLCMLVQNGCVDSLQVHVFAHVKKSVFAKKNKKWCNFWAPKTGAHFWTYHLWLQSNFLLKW